ncbi:ribokinase [Nocardioides psychrotolerans]|uniref:Fructokinase n=1 Tax=Nocardioides psychrotolerans TaxID=1005945 RepID=A0A1I3BL64_9ACTN|nr:carbohydrate kinase [Nocardioides psychrotolerans]GEP36580.1 ribokinase [Nocardioides psychrotolerans]SFH62920.1 fructokinase [Nocardioides psychrotolerans]
MEPYALVVGESLVDIVVEPDGRDNERPGGSAANVAVALARLGRRVRFVTSYADDDRGRAIAAHLGGSGVELAVDPHALERTSTARATIAADGSASYEFDLDWRFHPVGEVAPVTVHVCSIGAVLQPGAADVLRLLERLRATATISYDVNARPAITGTGGDVVGQVERVAALAHLVKASDEDLEALYPSWSVTDAARHLLSLGPRAVAVTRGESGSTWFTDEREVTVPAVRTHVVDTIGAGDTFSAGLIDALWGDQWDDLAVAPEKALAHAAAAAAVTVSRRGADPPYRHEL